MHPASEFTDVLCDVSKLPPAILSKPSGAKGMHVQVALHAVDPLPELRSGHFEAEHANLESTLCRGNSSSKRQRSFAHRRTGSQNDQIRSLPAAEKFIKGAKPGRNAGQFRPSLRSAIDILHGVPS